METTQQATTIATIVVTTIQAITIVIIVETTEATIIVTTTAQVTIILTIDPTIHQIEIIIANKVIENQVVAQENAATFFVFACILCSDDTLFVDLNKIK